MSADRISEFQNQWKNRYPPPPWWWFSLAGIFLGLLTAIVCLELPPPLSITKSPPGMAMLLPFAAAVLVGQRIGRERTSLPVIVVGAIVVAIVVAIVDWRVGMPHLFYHCGVVGWLALIGIDRIGPIPARAWFRAWQAYSRQSPDPQNDAATRYSAPR